MSKARSISTGAPLVTHATLQPSFPSTRALKCSYQTLRFKIEADRPCDISIPPVEEDLEEEMEPFEEDMGEEPVEAAEDTAESVPDAADDTLPPDTSQDTAENDTDDDETEGIGGKISGGGCSCS